MTTSSQPFDLYGELPSGRLSIEASAGTGKTYTLAALATRFIAEGAVSASELLIVTFTRAATGELRARVRERLVGAAAHLGHHEPPATDDQLLVHLASADRAARLDRLTRAVAEFDTATITTIHGFATQMLGGLGAAASLDPAATLVDDAVELSAEVCADVLAAAVMDGHDPSDLPSLKNLQTNCRIAMNSPGIVVWPEQDQKGASPADLLHAELLRRAIEVVDRRRRRAGTISFDDILVELQRVLSGSTESAGLAGLRSRFRVALIDEFQDTDPVQWSIFSALFGAASPDATLVLVGDPKQAIYSFRGADVSTYTTAVAPGAGTRRASLDTNWRSDGAVIRSLQLLFDGVTFGDGIPFVPVRPAPGNEDRRLVSRAGTPLPALSLRVANGEELKRVRNGSIEVAAAKTAVAHDLAQQVRELLEDGAIPVSNPTDGTDGDTGEGGAPARPASNSLPVGHRAVRPSDVAVLVTTADEAVLMQRALHDQGIPAVLARGGTVLASPAARHWRWLLDAMLRPADPRRARAFALSWFAGWTAEQVDAASEQDLAQLQEQLSGWAETLQVHGATEMVRRVWAESGVARRLLGSADGDRSLTDVEHVGELLQMGATSDHAGVAALLAVLDAAPATDLDPELDDDVAARRIESEEDAVQVMTAWVAKGLEFPIVCVPTMWRNRLRTGTVLFTDPDTGRRTFDVAKDGSWPDTENGARGKELWLEESCAEHLRLLYVALTRAQHQTLLWWSPANHAEKSALTRVLFARDGARLDHDLFEQRAHPCPIDAEEIAERLRAIADVSDGTIHLAFHGRPRPTQDRWVPPLVDAPDAPLDVARLDRSPDRSRHRWSFTSITARGAHRPVDPEDPTLGDRGAGDEAVPEPAEPIGHDALASRSAAAPHEAGDVDADPAAVAAPLAGLPAGADFGTLVHSVLEGLDVSSADLPDVLAERITEELARRPFDLTPPAIEGATAADGMEMLRAGLLAMVHTPLGALFDGRSLADIAPPDRLDELSFDLPLGTSGTPATDRAVGELIEGHLPSDDPLRPWAEQLATGGFRVHLAGHLTGSIDALIRFQRADTQPRFVVVDYKTNRLGAPGAPFAIEDYHRDRLVAAMAEHHYPLQALLYCVAVHRYLRWRLPGYDPARHLGGAAYLFVRGMTGPDAVGGDGSPAGVFSWDVPPALVVELSEMLDGRHRGGDGRRSAAGAGADRAVAS